MSPSFSRPAAIDRTRARGRPVLSLSARSLIGRSVSVLMIHPRACRVEPSNLARLSGRALPRGRLARRRLSVLVQDGEKTLLVTKGALERISGDVIAATPLRRLGGDEDLKGLALLLASDASQHITGQVIAVDGGASVV